MKEADFGAFYFWTAPASKAVNACGVHSAPSKNRASAQGGIRTVSGVVDEEQPARQARTQTKEGKGRQGQRRRGEEEEEIVDAMPEYFPSLLLSHPSVYNEYKYKYLHNCQALYILESSVSVCL